MDISALKSGAGASAHSPDQIEESVARENIKVIAEFPGLGNRVVSMVSASMVSALSSVPSVVSSTVSSVVPTAVSSALASFVPLRWSSGSASGQQQSSCVQQSNGDSTARICVAANHALNWVSHVYLAVQVGYEYAGRSSENLPAINKAINLTFNKLFGKLEPSQK